MTERTERSMWSRAAGWALATLAATLVVLSVPLPAGALDAAGVPVVIGPSGEAVNSGGSAAVFGLQLPSGAACPGDSYHKGYQVYSYAVPVGTDPAAVTFPSSVPVPGVDLITVAGVPFVSQFTEPDTAVIPSLPEFSWSRYDHDTAELPPGQYNVGIACVHGNGAGKVVKFWNVKVDFAASSRDPGGFTWRVVGAQSAPANQHTSDLSVVLIGLAALLALGLAITWAVHHRRRRLADSASS
jgi:hypothetical protein